MSGHGRGRGQGKGRGRGKSKQPCSEILDSDSTPPSTLPPTTTLPLTSGCYQAPATIDEIQSSSDSDPSCRPCHQGTMPSCYHQDSDDDSDQNDGQSVQYVGLMNR